MVITPNELADQARRLANYQQGRGLSSKVTLLQDIYNEFNYRIANPEAIRDFLEYARHNWRKAPRYKVSIGNGSGTYDYKNLTGKEETMTGLPRGCL